MLKTPPCLFPCLTCDAAADLRALSLDAVVGEAHMRSVSHQLHLEVVAAQEQALIGQRLAPVLEALGVLRVAVLPGGGVGDPPAALCDAQELMDGVQVDC